MSSRIAFPFLVLPDEAVSVHSWMVGDPGQPLQPATSVLENWDYARDLEVAISLSIDWRAAAEALQLPADSLRLKVSLVTGTGTGTLPRRQDRLDVAFLDRVTNEALVSGRLSGRTLSGRLQISLLVTLESPTAGGSVLSPNDLGAKLWSSHRDILIEDGGDSRFPVETASFSRIFRNRPHVHAPWYLHWRPGALHGDFSAGIRLYVNSDRPDWLSRVAGGDGPTLQAMMGDVMSQMVESALTEGIDAEDLAGCDVGSVGQQIRQWLETAFPAQEIASINALREQDPGAFRAALVAVADMGSADS